MQNIIVSQINGDVANPFNSRVILPVLIGEKETIAALYVVFRDIFALLDLCASVGLQQSSCAFIKDVLHQRGTIKLLRIKSAEQFSVSIVDANRSVNVGNSY